MKIKYIAVLILLGMMVTWVSALEPDSLQISIDRDWVVAGSKDIAQVTVKVLNKTDPVSSVKVNLWCEDEKMGTITPSEKKTDAGGTLSVNFNPNTTSGNANICAAVTSNSSIRDCTIIKIDHAEPKKWSTLSYPAVVPVNSNTTITVRLNDMYDNIVENRRYTENIQFSMAGSYGFWDGVNWVKKIVVPVDEDGNATTIFRTDTIAGSNFIRIDAPSTVLYNTQWITIRGIAVTPEYIISSVEPSSYQVYANNRDVFTITYRVTDGIGNPVPNVFIWRNTTLGERDRFITNSEGIAVTTYGPKRSIGDVTISAMVEDHPEISVFNTVKFVTSEAVMW
ncbi:MAG: hypothetical protein QHG99_09240, partial [Methanomicrobiales archaeon]|nr:hypothetical protein [Methanomicrobiales archaeon]